MSGAKIKHPLLKMSKAELIMCVTDQRSVLIAQSGRAAVAARQLQELRNVERERILVRDAILLAPGMPRDVVDFATKWLCGTTTTLAVLRYDHTSSASGCVS